MGLLHRVWREGWGLFVDDGPFAAGILACLAATWLLRRTGILPPGWAGPVLFAGLAVILLGSTFRRSRR